MQFPGDLDAKGTGTATRSVRKRVAEARRVQERRGRARGFRANADLPDGQLDELVDASAEARALLGRAVDRLNLSARGARRVLKVARTLADLAGEARTGAPAVAEALGYRPEAARRG